MSQYIRVTCPDCNGTRWTGKITKYRNRLCQRCGGDGFILRDVTTALDRLIYQMKMADARAKINSYKKR
jgi:DnaJ-class molecular chaperone